MEGAAAFFSRAVGKNGAVVLGHGKPIFRGAVTTPKHVLHASTRVEHRSPTKNAAMRCLWCVQRWHDECWKPLSVETVGKFSSGPGRTDGAIA
jgi:hypothetical protein